MRLDGLSAAAAAAAPEDAAGIVHELRVHQIELEMQNEELRGAHLELEAQREKYFELFDLAPVGYLIISDAGMVRDANLTAAHLLGVERQRLVGQPFSAFVLAADRDAFYLHHRTLQKAGEPQTCELRLQRVGGKAGDGAGGDAVPAHFWAHLESGPQRGADGETLSSWVTFADITERRLAEQALRESEERYRLLLQNMNDAVFVHELGAEAPGGFVDVNDRACEVLGYTREELLRMEVGAIDVPEQLERLPAIMAALHDSGRAVFETQHLTRDGRRVPVEVSVRVLDIEGRATVLSVARDIGERVQAERDLSEARRLLDETQTISRLGGWEYDVAGDRMHWTDEVYRIYGLDTACDPEDVEHAIAFYAPESAPLIAEAFRQALAAGTPYDLELELDRADGERIWVRTMGRPVVEDGEVVRVTGNIMDITERKQAEGETARTLSLLESTMESTADGILVADGRGGIVRFNVKFRETWGIPEAIIAAKDDDAALNFVLDQLKEPEIFLKTVRDLYGAPEEISYDVLELRDGRVLERYSQPQRIGDSVVGRVWSFRDITARKRAEEALAHLNAELVDEAAALAEANATITQIAATDHLTGLANRRCFYESLEKAVSLARRHGSPLALVSFDLDGLKRVNDSAGHRAGDEVLTSFADLLGSLCRAEDLPGRLGGDEFSLLLPGVDLSGARGLAERVLTAVRTCEALKQRAVTVSGGAAHWMPGELPDDLLRRADEALYAAKRDGGDAVAGDGADGGA